MKKFKLDDGGEYVSNDFEDFYRSKGIKDNKMTTHMPQQNGAAECHNRKNVEMVRCMLNGKRLPNHFCAEYQHWLILAKILCFSNFIK